MENTCCEGKCPYVKMSLCQSADECPNFVESWWHEGSTGQQKLVRDCAPKRIMIQLGLLQARCESAEAATARTAVQMNQMSAHFADLVVESRKVIAEQEAALLSLNCQNKPSLPCLNDQNKDVL